jgi:transposase
LILAALIQAPFRSKARSRRQGGSRRLDTISRGLLWNWRSQVRRGVLSPEPPPVFLPVLPISDPPTGNDAKQVAPSVMSGEAQVSDGKIEITLPDGTSVKVGHDVGLATLRRVITVLRR